MSKPSACVFWAGVLLAILSSCSRTETKGGASTSPARVNRVAVTAVQRSAIASEVGISAEFRPHQEVDVMAKVSGYLKTIHVDVGSRVAQGDVLATLEIPEMDDDLVKIDASILKSQADVLRAQQEVKRAETAHEIAHLSYSRLAAVFESKPGLVAQQEIDTARNRDLLAESQIAAAKSALASAEQAVKIHQADAGRARTLHNYTKVVAPFSGVVTKRFADPGAMVQAGTSSHTQALPLVRIAQVHTLRLILPIPESSVPSLRVGTPVEVEVESLGRRFQGRVARLTGQIASATRTMETEVDVPNPQGVLVPGMFAKATLRLEQQAAALSVPPTAIDVDKNEVSVLVVTDGKIERRIIQTGIETADRIQVRTGLREGELIVVGSRGQLKVGDLVEPKLLQENPSVATAKGS